MTQADFDAIVIGGGPAGASTAILLAEAGWSVALIEKQRFPRRKVCGECIAASNLQLFDALGVGCEFDAMAGPALRRVALMQGRHALVADLPACTQGRHRWGRALGRFQLDALLMERARRAGATIFQPWSVRSCDGSAGAWRCTIAAVESGEVRTLQAPVAIAAHGSWERFASKRTLTRRQAQGQSQGEAQERTQGQARDDGAPRRPSDLFAFKADFIGSALEDGLLPVLSFAGGYGGMVRADRGVTTVAGCIRRDALEAIRNMRAGRSAGEAFEAHVKKQCRGVDTALAEAKRDDAWLAVGPIRPGIRIGRAVDEPFLVGNAAGEAHPIVGEGISMAMQSAWLLCERLIARSDALLHGDESAGRLAVQRGYTRDWHHHFAARIRLAACFAHLAMRPSLSRGLLPLLKLRPALLADAARASGKVRCAANADTIAAIGPLRSHAPHGELLHDDA